MEMSEDSGSSSSDKEDLDKDEIEAEVSRGAVGSKSNPVKPGGTGRLETVGKPKGSGSKDRLVEMGKDVTKSEMAELKETVQTLAKAFEFILNAPNRKAVTSLPEFRLNKSEEKKAAMADVSSLSKTEIHTKLLELSKSEKLDAGERDRVNGYYFGTLKAEEIADIISKK